MVLAYMPKKLRERENTQDTIFPEGIESVPARFAVAWRNRWMILQSDFAITYVVNPWGGAAHFAELAKNKGRKVINIAEEQV